MEHSAKYSKVKSWYDYGFWTDKMVANAVVKGWITEEEYKDITGNDYNIE